MRERKRLHTSAVEKDLGCKKLNKRTLCMYIKRENKNAYNEKELSLAAPESNARFLVNLI